MVNIINKPNTLIKKNNLVKLLREKKIRSNPGSLLALTKHLEHYTHHLLDEIEEKLTIKGRKTLQKKDIKEILEKHDEENHPEI